MKKHSLLVVAMLLSIYCNSQISNLQFISTPEHSLAQHQFIFDYSVGEVVIFTFVTDSANLIQGIQQGKLTVTDIAAPQDADFALMVYCNPVKAELLIESVEHGKTFELYNPSSTLMKKGAVSEGKATIDMSDYTAGTYILKINGRKTHKIIKE